MAYGLTPSSLAIATWKTRQWIVKRRKAAWPASADEKSAANKGGLWNFSNVDIGVQQPQQVIYPHNSPATDASTGWVPQIKPWMRGMHVQSMEAAVAPPLPAKMRELSKMEGEKLFFKTSLDGSPPPSYLSGPVELPVAARYLPPPPPPPSGSPPSPPHPATPPTPPASLKLKFVPGFASTSTPAPSPPRTSSFASQQTQHAPGLDRPASASSEDSATSGSPRRKKLPRDMVVVQLFVPTMDDELAVAVGETLRLVEEFADGWCLCQRLGAGQDGQVVKGVLPRFCLDERPSSAPKKKRSLMRRL